MARATGIGSMPGTDFVESLKIATEATPDLPFIPELPARGPHAGMIGRTLGLITDLGADLQPDGWRIGVGEGLDQRRARSLLAHDLDVAEEALSEYVGPLKVQVTGPLTLAASVERPRGDKMLADHGARRELAGVLAGGLATHVADLRRRFPAVDLLVQVDEPAIRLVMEGRVPTASGWATHRRVDPPEADDLLRGVVEVIVEGGATPVLHSCGPEVPVELLRGLGFSALSFDLSLARPDDVWAEAFDGGMDLWIGVLPIEGAMSVVNGAEKVREFVHRLGFSPEAVADRLVVSTACGLAAATPSRARQLLIDSRELAARLDPT
ncbi:methionine synthase [Aeromicrobium sp. CF3.5]|uniref:methionine synthase n=1 Tax=Aeromicrobium sp. CF3.5 TaxID=3373078 RepID=UPI003EE75E6F